MADCKYFFSVIIPVYNVKDYLNACIESVISQSYRDFELILIDDGSSDGSEKICDEYKQKYENVTVIHKKNAGQSSARNIGVDISHGKYFIFVDSDDYIADNTLKMFYDKISQNGQLDVILSECMFNVEPDGKEIDIQRHLNSAECEGLNGHQAVIRMGMEWSPCGKCYRTEYWRKHEFRFIEGRISEDFQLIDRVTIDAEKVAMVPGHYFYRWKIPSSTMHINYTKLVKDTIFVIEDWEKYLLERKFENELYQVIQKRLANMLEHTVMGNVYYAEKDQIQGLIGEIAGCCEIIRYDSSIEGRLISFFIKLIGVGNTCYLLNLIKTQRKKKMSKTMD